MTDKWWPAKDLDDPKYIAPNEGPDPTQSLYVMQYDRNGNPLGFINIYDKEEQEKGE